MQKLLLLWYGCLFAGGLFAQVNGWDTLEFRAPLTELNHTLRWNERLVVAHKKGLSYSDDYGGNWQPSINAPRNAYALWSARGNIYASRYINGNDSTWVSQNGGQSFVLWDNDPLSTQAGKVIRGDTMLFIQGQVFRKIKGVGSIDILLTLPGFNYSLQLLETGDRLVLLSTDGIRWSDDDGQSWTMSASNIPINNLCIGCDRILIHHNVLFFHNRSNVVLRSTDAGQTWDNMPFFQQGQGGGLRDLISEGDDLLATTYHDFPETSPQVWRSSDLGQSWQRTYPEITEFEYLIGAFPTLAGNRLITNQSCYAVSNNDSVWETQNTGLPKTPVGYAERISDQTWLILETNRLFRTENNGRSYRVVHINHYNHFGHTERQGNTLLASPADTPGFLRSDDGGVTWHPDSVAGQSIIQLHCRENEDNLLVLFLSGALYRYRIPSAQWEFLSNMGQVSYMAFNNGVLFVDAPNGVRASVDYGNSFTLLTDGFSPFYAPGPIFSFGNTVMVSAASFELYVSKDQGLHWTIVDGPETPPFPVISQLAVSGDALAASIFLAGFIYFSDDGGLHWSQSAVPLQSFGEVTVSFLKQFEGDVYANFSFGGEQYFIKRKLEGLGIARLKGRVFQDTNQNNVQDNGEPGMPGEVVQGRNDQFYTYTNPDGDYSLVFNAPTDTLETTPPFIHYTVTPARHIVQAPADSLDFALYTDFDDLELSIGSGSAPRPGFQQNITFDLFNAGIRAEKARLTALFDPQFIVEASNPPASLLGDTLVWVLDTLPSYEHRFVTVTCRLMNTATIGSPVFIEGALHSLLYTDDFQENNLDTLAAFVVGSFDPNDKTALIGSTVLQNALEQGRRLEYLIRFQNTGNYPAEFVHILDTLSPEFVPQSLRVEASSHPVQLQLPAPGVVDFFFPGIHLPDSISDESGSHGFVRFSIEARRNLEAGALLRNRAAIYFDYNPPVVTNEALTAVINDIGTKGSSGLFTCRVQPNPAPANTRLRLFPFESPATVRIYAPSGRLYRTETAPYVENEVVVNGLPSGVWILHVKAGKRRGIGMVVVE